jgi:PAS domain S-box-containing protein
MTPTIPHGWETLIDTLVVPASVHGVDGRFLHMNSAAERASGRASEDMAGRHFTELLPQEARANVEAQFARAAGRGEPTDFETSFFDAGGQLRGVRALYVPLRHGDEITGVLILAFDAPRPFIPDARGPDPRLTSRQQEILALVAAGLSTGAVAKELTLSRETVRNHLRNASRELRAHSRVEAIATAQRLGLLSPPPLAPQRSDARVH